MVKYYEIRQKIESEYHLCKKQQFDRYKEILSNIPILNLNNKLKQCILGYLNLNSNELSLTLSIPSKYNKKKRN